jgi:hypothetical protein
MVVKIDMLYKIGMVFFFFFFSLVKQKIVRFYYITYKMSIRVRDLSWKSDGFVTFFFFFWHLLILTHFQFNRLSSIS